MGLACILLTHVAVCASTAPEVPEPPWSLVALTAAELPRPEESAAPEKGADVVFVNSADQAMWLHLCRA